MTNMRFLSQFLFFILPVFCTKTVQLDVKTGALELTGDCQFFLSLTDGEGYFSNAHLYQSNNTFFAKKHTWYSFNVSKGGMKIKKAYVIKKNFHIFLCMLPFFSFFKFFV